MKCPYCDGEMEKGYLQTMQRAAWVKKPHKISLLPKEGEVLLWNHSIKGCIFATYICKVCKKMVVDYSDKDIEQGQ